MKKLQISARYELVSTEKEPHASEETVIKYCLYCGEGFPTKALFCSKCGKKQSDT